MIADIKSQYHGASYEKLMNYFDCDKSNFYRWKKGGSSNRCSRKNDILKLIKVLFEESRSTYGSPRIRHKLKERGYSISKNTVAKYMRELGLDARRKKKRCYLKTTDSQQENPIPERIFKVEDKNTMPDGPGKTLAADITYILLPTLSKLYLAVVMDVFNREIVGWNLRSSLKTELILKALEVAISKTSPESRIIHHSDRGCQYTSVVYNDFLRRNRILPSISRRGNCYDNAYVESFFSTLKRELIYRLEVTSEEDVRYELLKYIDLWYNKNRSHSSLDYLSPYSFRNQYVCENQGLKFGTHIRGGTTS